MDHVQQLSTLQKDRGQEQGVRSDGLQDMSSLRKEDHGLIGSLDKGQTIPALRMNIRMEDLNMMEKCKYNDMTSQQSSLGSCQVLSTDGPMGSPSLPRRMPRIFQKDGKTEH